MSVGKKVLIVTIALGEKYLSQYNLLFRKSQEDYARKYGYDFKVVTDFIETELSQRHPSTISFQKILVCAAPWSDEYDKIVYVDADVFINIDAPPIAALPIGDKIGIVNEYMQPTYEERLAIQKLNNWEPNPSAYYKLASEDFVLDTTAVLNTGVMIFQPKLHKELLYNIYAKHVASAVGHYRKFHFEQSAIGYELQIKQMYVCIENKWNAVWGLNRFVTGANKSLYDFYRNNYFTHFAGYTGTDKIPALQRTIKLRTLLKNIPLLNKL
jgi:lipopolysaccharide biosynthesis glycosyltransferase